MQPHFLSIGVEEEEKKKKYYSSIKTLLYFLTFPIQEKQEDAKFSVVTRAAAPPQHSITHFIP